MIPGFASYVLRRACIAFEEARTKDERYYWLKGIDSMEPLPPYGPVVLFIRPEMRLALMRDAVDSLSTGLYYDWQADVYRFMGHQLAESTLAKPYAFVPLEYFDA